LPIQKPSVKFIPLISDNANGEDTVKTKIYYEIHSKRGHVSTTDDKIDVREALDKNLIVIEIQETAFYLTEAVVKTSIYRQIKTI
jgi:hypothetical protein